MSIFLEIVSTAWLCNLFVAFYIHICIKRKIKPRKPFGCQKCMGFWVGCSYFLLTGQDTFIIFGALTSLISALLYRITDAE